MNTKEFVKEFIILKENLIKNYFELDNPSEVSHILQKSNLGNEESLKLCNHIINDTIYSILLGLDGAASIGQMQVNYRVIDENGIEIFKIGGLEAEAFNQIHGNNNP